MGLFGGSRGSPNFASNRPDILHDVKQQTIATSKAPAVPKTKRRPFALGGFVPLGGISVTPPRRQYAARIDAMLLYSFVRE